MGILLNKKQITRYLSRTAFPTRGLKSKLYVAEDTGLFYTWNGSAYKIQGQYPQVATVNDLPTPASDYTQQIYFVTTNTAFLTNNSGFYYSNGTIWTKSPMTAGALTQSDIDDNLTSTNSLRVLSSNQGRVLNEKIDNLTANDINDLGEFVDDEVALLIQDNIGITWTYDDSGNTLTPTLSDSLEAIAPLSAAEATVHYSTGLISGGVMTINANPAKVDISNGTGIVVDNFTDPLNQVITPVSWTGLTAITITNLATTPRTYFGIDSTGAVIQQGDFFTNEQQRDLIGFWLVNHPNNTSVQSITHLVITAWDTSTQFSDLAESIGIINTEGNVISANGANLNINRTAGKQFRLGSNFAVSRKNPSIISSLAATALTFRYRYRNGSGGYTEGADRTTLDVGNYDNNSGTPATVPPSDKFQINRVYVFGSGLVRLMYGQQTYKHLADAEAALFNEVFDADPNLLNNASLRGWIITSSAATALNDPLFAKFIIADKFGTSASGGTSSSTTTLQVAYNNSAEPEILTDSTRGAVTIRRGSTADTDNVLEIQNNAGTINFSVTGDGLTTTASLNISTFTTGSIVFAGTSGLISQDNANFFWDDTNNRLCLGTTTSRQRITIGSATPFSTTTPECIDMGGSFSSVGGTNLKFKTYNDGFVEYGFGVEANNAMYCVPNGANHRFYVNGVSRFFISNNNVNIQSTTASTSNATGALLIAGGIGISNTTDATSSTSGGTFTTAGGMSIAKSLWVGTVANIAATGSNTALKIGSGNTDVNIVNHRVYSTSGTWRGSAAFGGSNNSVIMGELATKATIGGHNAALNAWADFYIQPVGNTRFGSTTAPSATVDITGTLGVSGIATSSNATASTSSTTGGSLLAGGIGISNTTDATSSTNGGTFTTAGGGAIAKKLYVGTSVNADTCALTNRLTQKEYFVDCYNNVVQTLTSATNTAATFNTDAVNTNFGSRSPTTKFTPPLAGWWDVSYTFWFAPNATGIRSAWIQVNGSDTNSYANSQVTASISPSGTAVNGTAKIYFNGTTNYAEIYVYQNSGGNLNIGGTSPNYLTSRASFHFSHA